MLVSGVASARRNGGSSVVSVPQHAAPLDLPLPKPKQVSDRNVPTRPTTTQSKNPAVQAGFFAFGPCISSPCISSLGIPSLGISPCCVVAQLKPMR